MSGFLLDTNCISEVVRIQPEPRVLAWMDAADESSLYLSVFTLGEIRKGIITMVEGKRRAKLETWLDSEVTERFAGRILPVDAAIADQWAPSPAKCSAGVLRYPQSMQSWPQLHYIITSR